MKATLTLNLLNNGSKILEKIPKREYTTQIFSSQFARVLRIVFLSVQEFSYARGVFKILSNI